MTRNVITLMGKKIEYDVRVITKEKNCKICGKDLKPKRYHYHLPVCFACRLKSMRLEDRARGEYLSNVASTTKDEKLKKLLKDSWVKKK